MSTSLDLAIEYAETFYENTFDDARQSVLRAMKGQPLTPIDEQNVYLMANRIFALACSERYGNRALWMLQEAGPFLLDYIRIRKYPPDMLSPFYMDSFDLLRTKDQLTSQNVACMLLAWGLPEALLAPVMDRLCADPKIQPKFEDLTFNQIEKNVQKPKSQTVDSAGKTQPPKKNIGNEQEPTKSTTTGSQLNVTPAEIADYYRKSVRGQEEAVQAFAIAIKDHSCRPTGVKKSNIMVLGPTGCGKTFLGRISAKYLDVPFGEAKMSTKSSTGYRGDNLSSIFQDVLDQSKGPEALKRAILLLDEIDKLSLVMDDKGFGSQLQNELIGFVESSNVRAETGVRTTQPIDTTEMLFIGAGAFVGLNYIIAERIGACGKVSDMEKIIRGEIVPSIILRMPDEELFAQVSPDDLIRYGLRPELVGRFPVITFVRPLKAEDFIDILKNSSSSPLAQQLRLLSEGYKVECAVDESAYGPMALKAVELKTGARALEPICNMVFRDIKFNTKPGTKVRIDADYVKKVLPSNGKSLLLH